MNSFLRKFLCLVFIILVANFTYAKPLKVNKIERLAFKAYLNKDYHQALTYLFQLDTLNDNQEHLYDYWIGMCLLSTENKLAAIPYLENAKRFGATSFVIHYYLGRAYLYAGRLEEARQHLNIYATVFKQVKGDFELEEKVENEGHRIHVEKTLEYVYGLLAECEARLLVLNE